MSIKTNLETEYGYYPERITEVLKEHGLLSDSELQGFEQFVRGY